jgi:hypothetical protein
VWLSRSVADLIGVAPGGSIALGNNRPAADPTLPGARVSEPLVVSGLYQDSSALAGSPFWCSTEFFRASNVDGDEPPEPALVDAATFELLRPQLGLGPGQYVPVYELPNAAPRWSPATTRTSSPRPPVTSSSSTDGCAPPGARPES